MINIKCSNDCESDRCKINVLSISSGDLMICRSLNVKSYIKFLLVQKKLTNKFVFLSFEELKQNFKNHDKYCVIQHSNLGN